MALIKCAECGETVSDQADTCPHCGFPLGRPTIRRLKAWMINVVAFVLGIGLVLSYLSRSIGWPVLLAGVALLFGVVVIASRALSRKNDPGA